MGSARGPGRLREWIYRQLLRVHPHGFRRDHHVDLLTTFREAWTDRARGRGPVVGLRFWWRILRGETRAGLSQRLEGAARIAAAIGPSAPELAGDVRFALRIFRRSPGLTAAVVLTLGIGIGGSSAVFATFYDVYRSALPFRDGERLVRLRSYSLGADGAQRAFNFPPRSTVVVARRNRSFTDVEAMNATSLTLTGEGSPERVSAVEATGGWTDLLGVELLLGRSFTPEEAAEGSDAGVVILSHSLWQRRFGGDPGVIGRTLAIDGGDLTIVGVMPPRFNYPYEAQLWTPLRLDATDARSHDLNTVARLRPGVDVAAARRDMARIYADLRAEDPGIATDDGILVTTVRRDFIRDDGRMVQALLVAVGFFLLLACVNVANLLTAHFLGRRREVGIRAALGASGGRRLRQTVTETVVLFLGGALAGLLLTAWLGDLLLVLLPNVFRTELDVGTPGVGGPALAFGLGSALAAGALSGLAAAWRAGRTDLRAVLHEGGRAASGGRGRLQDALVVSELALSVVLLLGAGVMLDHFRRLREEDLGFRPDGVQTLQLSLEGSRYAETQVRLQLVHALEDRLAAVPGVEDVGITTVNPLCCGDWGAPVEIEGQPVAPDGTPALIRHRYVTPRYFTTMEIPLLEGRGFRQSDRPGGPLEVVVDASLARRRWPGQDPVGKRIRVAREGEEWRTVVGVVGDTWDMSDYDEGWYLPFYEEPTGRSTGTLHLLVRLRSESALATVRAAIVAVDPNLPVFGAASMRELRRRNLAQDRLGAVLTTAFAAFGLLLAVVGLYGLMAHLVGLRTREIGTRIALGASRGHVLGMVLARAARLVAIGSAVGVALALLLNRALGSLVVGVRMAGPEMFGPLLAVLVAFTAGAVVAPALRAARIDPVRAFRAE